MGDVATKIFQQQPPPPPPTPQSPRPLPPFPPLALACSLPRLPLPFSHSLLFPPLLLLTTPYTEPQPNVLYNMLYNTNAVKKLISNQLTCDDADNDKKKPSGVVLAFIVVILPWSVCTEHNRLVFDDIRMSRLQFPGAK